MNLRNLSHTSCLLICFFLFSTLKAEDGYDLWLRYEKITNAQTLLQYRKQITGWRVESNSPQAR
jgi:alpha-glucuronidase